MLFIHIKRQRLQLGNIHDFVLPYNQHNEQVDILISKNQALQICDWASKNGPSGHTKFDIFQLCWFITKDLLTLLK